MEASPTLRGYSHSSRLLALQSHSQCNPFKNIEGIMFNQVPYTSLHVDISIERHVSTSAVLALVHKSGPRLYPQRYVKY